MKIIKKEAHSSTLSTKQLEKLLDKIFFNLRKIQHSKQQKTTTTSLSLFQT
jgi:hypothetical protein